MKSQHAAGNSAVERVRLAEFLGNIIDEKLVWKHHVDNTSSKIASSTGRINKLKR